MQKDELVAHLVGVYRRALGWLFSPFLSFFAFHILSLRGFFRFIRSGRSKSNVPSFAFQFWGKSIAHFRVLFLVRNVLPSPFVDSFFAVDCFGRQLCGTYLSGCPLIGGWVGRQMKFSKKSGAGVGVTRRELVFLGGIKDGELGVGRK